MVNVHVGCKLDTVGVVYAIAGVNSFGGEMLRSLAQTD